MLLLLLNINTKFLFSLLELEQYLISILLFQLNFFSCKSYLIFSYCMIILFTITYFMGFLASDYLTNLCSHCTVWMMIVCEGIFVHLQTIWLGCVGVCSPLLLSSCMGRVRASNFSSVSLSPDLGEMGHSILGQNWQGCWWVF